MSDNKMNTATNIGCGCVLGAISVIVLPILLIALAIYGLSKAVSTNGEELLGENALTHIAGGPECDKPLAMKWMCGHGDEDDPKVVYIPMRGIIADAQMDESIFARATSDYASALRSIRAATRDESIRGICLKLDTPGGTVTDADIMADALRRFKAADTNRFVLVMMGSMCCSGGYYVATEADYIMANPTTLTGSIGVILHGLNAAELANKIGLKSVNIASGANKALLDPLTPVDPEHVAILKRPVEQDYERFVSLVARGRKLPVDEVRKLADGRVISARDALDAKLIDALGYAEDAWDAAADLAQADDVRIYRYVEPYMWRRIFSSDAFMECGRAFANGMKSGVDDTAPHNEYRLR